MATTSAKALVLADEIKADLARRIPSLAVSAIAYDTDGAPWMTLGTGAANSESAVIKIMPEATPVLDVLGLAQTVFCPHKVQIILEDRNALTGVPYLKAAKLLELFGLLAFRGLKVELFECPKDTAPALAEATAAQKMDTFEPSQKWKQSSGQ